MARPVLSLAAFRKDVRGDTTLNVALAFAAFAIVGALVAVPQLNSSKPTSRVMVAVDETMIDRRVTGSVEKLKPRRFVVRRSVLQKDPALGCTIHADGSRQGSCATGARAR